MAGTHRVTLTWPDGREERVEADPGETVLEAAERAGVALPFGCRTGACASCCGRVDAVGGDESIGGEEAGGHAEATGGGETAGGDETAGDDETAGGEDEAVAYRRPPRALKPRHRGAGFILCCVAHPLADLRVTVGATVRPDLVGNPWL